MTIKIERDIEYTEAIILAGGFGTRLKEVVTDLPKPMAPINEVPFLNYLLNYLTHFGIKHIVISTGHLSEKITDYYNSLGKKPEWGGAKLSFSHESSPLGTGGAIRLALEKCKQKQVLVLNGDSFFDFDIKQFSYLHKVYHSNFSLALRTIDNAARYGTVECSNQNQIETFKEKSGLETEGLINAGIYIIKKEPFLSKTESNKNFSIEKDFFEKQLTEEKIYGFKFDGYFIDIGIPEDYSKAQNDFKEFKYR